MKSVNMSLSNTFFDVRCLDKVETSLNESCEGVPRWDYKTVCQTQPRTPTCSMLPIQGGRDRNHPWSK
jgi:hypothetical protein